ncbi:hypothetical protein [Streptomyces sp. YS-3]|uniref:hypothetical protein n=1 Tax=Streptomyces sp. YS-3 TaxID=3381352 RepID=UPI0038629680
MSHHTHADKNHATGDADEKDTALGEVMRELEDAATEPEGSEHGRHGHEDGEAGDALTPNTEAQKRAEH